MEEHCSNPQCFKEQTTKLNSQPAQYEKKIDQDNFRKKIIQKEKKNHVAKHCSNPHCFKEKNYKVKISTSSILKKIKSTKTIFKKKTQKK